MINEKINQINSERGKRMVQPRMLPLKKKKIGLVDKNKYLRKEGKRSEKNKTKMGGECNGLYTSRVLDQMQ